ncbi:MAG: hypothetical protein Q7U88_13060, partial [Desulfocapsaceae bacterium]|nr:hypothetical protein [Desulfocapsaceae bacterium]
FSTSPTKSIDTSTKDFWIDHAPLLWTKVVQSIYGKASCLVELPNPRSSDSSFLVSRDKTWFGTQK